MSSSLSLSNIFQTNLLASLTDSQTREIFVDPQIVNCPYGHTFSLSTVQKIYGQMVKGLCQMPKKCPDCCSQREFVTMYWPNTRLAEIVKVIIGPVLIPEKVQSIMQSDRSLQYPLPPSSFVLKWLRMENTESDTLWHNFMFIKIPETKSPIKTFKIGITIKHLYESQEKKLATFYFESAFESDTDANKFVVYLSRLGIFTEASIHGICLKTDDSRHFLAFVDHLMNNNIFNEYDLEKFTYLMKQIKIILEFSE